MKQKRQADRFPTKWGQLFQASSVQSLTLLHSSFVHRLFFNVLCFLQVMPRLSDKIHRRTIQFLSISSCSSGFLTSTDPSLRISKLKKKKKVLKIESSEKHETTKQARAIQDWIRTTVWSSSEAKTCASGIWLCREEDSWPTWWRTPSTGKARSWWTTSLREQTEEKHETAPKKKQSQMHKSDLTVEWMTEKTTKNCCAFKSKKRRHDEMAKPH